jgi:PEP-CTERM motif
MRKLASSLAVMAFIGTGWAAPCAAAPVTFDFSGAVTQTTFNPSDPFAGAIGIGTTFSGSYTFETTAADGNPFASNGSYSAFGAPYQFAVTIGGGFTFSTSDALTINTGNGPADQYSVLACAGGPFCFGSNASLFLEDLNGTVFAGDALPYPAPALSAFETALFTFNGFVDGAQVEIIGQLGSLVCSAGCDPVGTPIPEPGTLLLVGSALAALRVRRRRA